ncbi:MAG: hypothetical protein ACKO0W_06675, partial [Planctomycetota bacterium]
MNRPGPANPAPSARELANLLASARAAGAPRALAAPAIASFFMLVAIFLHASPARAFLLATPGSRAAHEESQMKMVGAAVVSSFLAASGAVAQDAVQWRVQDGGNGHWYQLYYRVDGRNWSGWSLEAQSMGGHLVTLSTAAEIDFVASVSVFGSDLPSCVGGHALIGLYQPSGSGEPDSGWRWVTGEPFVFDVDRWGSLENCCAGSPYCSGEGEDAAAMWSWAGDCEDGVAFAGKWNDVGKCLDWWGAIFEWSADCNGDGIVDYGQILTGALDDANGNNIPDCCEGAGPCPCQGDVDDSGAVNGVDLAAILNVWGT